MDIINKVDEIWSNSTFKKPSVFYGVYNNTIYVTVSNMGPIYYFVSLSAKKPHIFSVVSAKCHLTEVNGIKYYQILDTQDDINLGKTAVIPIGCSENKFSAVEYFTAKNILPVILG
jgi:hypothetical protein